MTKVGMQTYKPVISIAPAPTDEKRKGEFWVSDIRSDVGRINTMIAKAKSVGITVQLEIQTAEDGTPRICVTSAVRP